MANGWNKTTFGATEFEATLRRRLKSGAGPVVACAGFDLDSASAYLEGALGGSQRARYESHLAGCAACRRHVIELSRLAQTVAIAEAPRPMTAPNQTAFRDRWREVVAGWFDISAWELKWRIAGATGAAFAVLIAALSAKSWRQESNLNAVASETSVISMSSPEPDAAPFQSPTPELSQQNSAGPVAENSMAIHQQPSQVPAPSVEPKVSASDFAFTASRESLALSESAPSAAPGAPRADSATADQNQPPRSTSFVAIEGLTKVGGSVFREYPKEAAAQGTVPGLRITPPRGCNPMDPAQMEPCPPSQSLTPVEGQMIAAANLKQESREAPSNKPSSGKSSLGFSLGPVADLLKRAIPPVRMPGRLGLLPDSERRAKPDKPKEPDDDAPKPMLIPIRDKLFRFERGMLIDREYNPETQEWRVWTIERGTEQYKKVLAEEPLLKEFFDRGPIIIVWKNRIYKALK